MRNLKTDKRRIQMEQTNEQELNDLRVAIRAVNIMISEKLEEMQRLELAKSRLLVKEANLSRLVLKEKYLKSLTP
jgi:hypothetical protein